MSACWRDDFSDGFLNLNEVHVGVMISSSSIIRHYVHGGVITASVPI